MLQIGRYMSLIIGSGIILQSIKIIATTDKNDLFAALFSTMFCAYGIITLKDYFKK